MAHGRSCALSLRGPSTCRCECGGRLHGLAWAGETPDHSDARRVASRQKKVRRAIAVAITITAAAVTVSLTVTGSPVASENVSSSLSVQVKVDLSNAISGLSSAGFGGKILSSSASSDPSHRTDCAGSASGQVKEFLSEHHCKQYTAQTWAITAQDRTTEIGFSWVEMPSASLASHYKMVVDTYRTGNPPGVPPAAFDGRCYSSDQKGPTVWAIEVQPTGNVEFDQGVLQAAARESLSQEYLHEHCNA